MNNLYADRDHEQLGEHYVKHVAAMTAEGLHAKSDIAAELAYRDAEITRLRDDLEREEGVRMDAQRQLRELRAELAAKDAVVDALRGFAQAIIRSWPEGDVDGGDLQDHAAHFGLLAPFTVTEPCREDCACAEVDDFPLTCYRLTELLRGPAPKENSNG